MAFLLAPRKLIHRFILFNSIIQPPRYFSSSSFRMPTGPVPVPPQAAPSWDVTADHILSTVNKSIEQSKALLDDFATQDSPTWDSTLKRYLQFNAETDSATTPLLFFQNVSPHKDLRDASTKADELLSAYEIDAAMRVDVYKTFSKVFPQLEKLGLDAESLRAAKKIETRFKRDGLDLDDATREKITALRKRLSTLSIQFAKNMADEDGSLEFTAEELTGVPESVLEQLTKTEDNKYKMTFKYPDVFPVLKYAQNADVRKKVFTGFDNRNLNNDDLLAEGVKIRSEIAPLLGYENHSAFVLDDRMAKTPANVLSFLGDLHSKLKPKAQQDVDVLLKYKAQDYKERDLDFDGKLYSWDLRFYANKLLETEYKIDAQQIANYFPLQSTVDEVLSLYEHVLRLKFYKVADSDKQVWHEDVHQFHVWDASEDGKPTEFLGWFYLDLHPRPNKYGHAANFNLSPGYIDAKSGERVHPVTALVCNFSKPTEKKPSLLKHDEVVTLFHEMGHGIHNLVSKTRYSRFHGTSVEWDFVEAPSQMLEYWPWNKAQLKQLSKHYESGEPLSDSLIDSLIRTKHVNDGINLTRQVFLASFDLAIHLLKKDEPIDLVDKWYQLRTEYCLDTTGDFKSHAFSAFGHLMGGYDSGYYGYLWSEVFACDMYYTKFKADPLNSQAGYEYKTKVIGPGGSRDAMDSLKDFLGREPNNVAFMEELGVSEAGSSGNKL
ncbi:uncharacterized protein SAPINGB_P005998 [Magnusiomyces paraingens]|uniref:Peptidase M3A/M3B catalytic domain-containing protein n=1 Tax=Magnusiomyces paraingens TaxID=2606893 RepID=A0A5E8C3V5_9ASCO|nr:uncharacterized protein SAPINGB_P005998 [Saprochaete ingens]VVT58022.1 unnamed protein product [Saprochaete ingens]